MRRIAGPLLFGLGAFLLVAGLLLRFYAYPKLATAPIDQNSVTRLEATGATLFDTTTLKEIQTDLTIQSRTVGDVKASEDAGNNTRVWVGTTSIRSSDGVVRSRSTNRTPFEGTTAEAVNCCGAFVETSDGEREQVKRDGLVWKYPFSTEKKSYKVWDSTLGKTVTSKYVKETKIQGMDVYVFKSVVPRTEVGTQDVPASVVGEPGTGNVTAQSMYANTTTVYVEPVTGAIIDQKQETTNTLAVDDEDKVTTTKADIAYTKAQVGKFVDDISGKAPLLTLVHSTLPIITVILGLILMVVGFLLGRRNQAATTTLHRRSTRPGSDPRPALHGAVDHPVGGASVRHGVAGRSARRIRLMPRRRFTGSHDSMRTTTRRPQFRTGLTSSISLSLVFVRRRRRATGRSSTFQPIVSWTTKPACSTSETSCSRS